jgi:hypothetical protein
LAVAALARARTVLCAVRTAPTRSAAACSSSVIEDRIDQPFGDDSVKMWVKNPGFENSPSVTKSIPQSTLLAHALCDHFRQQCLKGVFIVGLVTEPGLHHVEQRMRPRRTADVRRLHPVDVVLNSTIGLNKEP